MARSYSERILSKIGFGYSATHTVPDGHREVLKSIIGFNPNTGGGGITLEFAGKNLWQVNVPGSTGAVSAPFMLVLYEGDQIRLYNSLDNMFSVVCGYRFREQ